MLSTHCVLPTESDEELPFSLSPTGHWHGPEELAETLCYVAETEDGRRLLLTPDQFEEEFGWRNNPAQVRLTPVAENAASGTLRR